MANSEEVGKGGASLRQVKIHGGCLTCPYPSPTVMRQDLADMRLVSRPLEGWTRDGMSNRDTNKRITACMGVQMMSRMYNYRLSQRPVSEE